MKRIATSMLLGLGGLGILSTGAQTQYSRPKLVVGIVVDQLRTDYIEQLREYFGRNGFNTLIEEGVYIRDLDFGTPVSDAASATGMLYTGAWPSETGVASACVYDPITSSLILPLAPVAAGSPLNSDSFTPAPIRVTTIGDELSVATDGAASIYSISMDPQQAVIMAGHTGKGAYWVNNTSGNWATSGYYGTLPSPLSTRNNRSPLSARIDTMKWSGSPALTRIGWLPPAAKSRTFQISYNKRDRDAYRRWSESALSNTEITDAAIDIIGSLNLGQGSGTDMLSIAYTAAPYSSPGTDSRVTLTDTYLRLDAQLARLIEAIDRRVGRGNAIIWLSSTGYCEPTPADESRLRLPHGEFSVTKAKSLLNSYLGARYGNAQYVLAIRDSKVYFDHKAIESLRLDAEKVISDARQFLLKMSGVSEALTIHDILSGTTPEHQQLRRSLDAGRSGDILLSFTPGWVVAYDDRTPMSYKDSRRASTQTPAFLLMPGMEAEIINTPVEAARLAPTIAGAMRIRAPSGAKAKPLLPQFKR